MMYVPKKKPEAEPAPKAEKVEETPAKDEVKASDTKPSERLSEANKMLQELTDALKLAKQEIDKTKATYNSQQVRINQMKDENKRLKAEIREQDSQTGNGNERLLQKQLKEME